MEERRSWLSGVVDGALRGNFAILLIVVSLLAGLLALLATPREEEPQITVPMADVLISYPGGSAEEVERLVSSRLERLLWEIDGVEYVYSMSRPGLAVVTVRFFVGEDREGSLIKLYNKIFQNIDRTTPGIAGWVVKPLEIDDVPIVTAALYSDTADTHALYRVAEEVVGHLQHIPEAARITIHGGEPRVLRVVLDTERLAAYGLSPNAVAGALQMSNAQAQAGEFEQANERVLVQAGPFLEDAAEVRNLLVGVHGGRPVYLRDVAKVVDGPDERTSLSRIGFGPAAAAEGPAFEARWREGVESPAVVIAVAKRRGSNAVSVAREVHARLDALRGPVIPDDVAVRITRDYGATANEKVNDLVKNLGQAILTVIVLITVVMNGRAGLIIAVAIPITYGLTLLFNHLMGYTINRVTLFALILALGLLVDDPIVGVENIDRYLRMGRYSRFEAASRAMGEVLTPIVLTTLAIIAAFLPMFFISGMMGPYMRPMAVNVPLAVTCSTLVAVLITPWLASKILRPPKGAAPAPESAAGAEEAPRDTALLRGYRRLMSPLVASRAKARGVLAMVGLLFLGAVSLVFTGAVPLKMLPFDNKNELQIVVDMPEASTLEATDAVVRDIEALLRTVPEVTDFTASVGAGSPMDFNGMVRRYYMREGPHLADVRVNLAHRSRREHSSHAIALRLRNDIDALARRHNAMLRIVETPPGPPVLASVVAEIYGAPHHRHADLVAAAKTVEARLAEEPGVVEADTAVESSVREVFFRVDREKAGLSGISTADIAQTVRIALSGLPAGVLHSSSEQNETPILLRLPREERSDLDRLGALRVTGRDGAVAQVGELGRFEERGAEPTIYRKNLERVVYVTAEMAGRGPAYAVLAMQRWLKDHPLPSGLRAVWTGEGEWKITVDVFRDLGIAFGIALIGIYVLLVYETKSYALPGVIMMSIPLTVIGIMPGFALLNVIANRPVGGYENPVFFTATAMIGMIVLAGIVIRNGILLIDFIRTAVARGRPLREAILESGATRLRPIFLTAGTTMLGSWPITFDPIFSGLAWSLIFGLFVSTAFTLVVIPATYYLLYAKKEGGAPAAAPEENTP
jgi:multidrug efflux pump subunit AcrB